MWGLEWRGSEKEGRGEGGTGMEDKEEGRTKGGEGRGGETVGGLRG